MSRIRNKDTKPEMLVRKFLYSNGLRYRLHDKRLPGKPDIVFSGRRIVIFIHGCFWHGHENCKFFVAPKTKSEWWLNKINSNKNKDSENITALIKKGWKVITIWECELKSDKKEETLRSLLNEFKIGDG